ncbi:uncharacterized protein F4822DRAFT_413583 [Hypoxylon trugodes]|uniref:uncharacterized protein n=1 Tax=Hypoxylon trugodes TaxID=326681 RepID=UPI00219C782B|nr:uncharacterized protein F4822DRAFT_413583 [Hypoxylon trugodes]KAI1385594.1 hypothetical protein F4822DRAFT_413583 [Hypoxylon trugodes]
MGEEQDLPIALRRTRRSSVGTAVHSDPSRLQTANTASTPAKTPSKPRSRKRVRFSDPRPAIEHHDVSATTGLTPMVGRTSLSGPSPKRRRHSTPLRRRSCQDADDQPSNNGNGTNNEVRFLSLRQVLDDRVKRRIRRNGLSEEMNTIQQEKRRGAQERQAELQRLRDELAEKDLEIDRLQNTTVIQDTDRILELESEVRTLRDELRSRSRRDDVVDETHAYDWTLAARDPFSDSYMDDDEGFGESTMAELVCSTPSKRRASASFPTPPCTSPTIPATPCSTRGGFPETPQSHAGVQAMLPDPEKEALEAELGSLRLELTKLTDVLESHEALKTRIADKLNATSPPPDPEHSSDVEAHLDTVLQALSDRTAALMDLNSSLSALGFPGNDAGEIVSSLVGAFRSARLELEYLTPGEIALPLSSHGAQVLDMVLNRLRDLARRAKEDEDAIDEYHALELSLRQQLGARVDAMDSLRKQLGERDARITDLEVGTERLKGAAEGYRRDVAELESLVQRMEEEGKTAEAQLTDSKIAAAELEAKLEAVREQAEAFQLQLTEQRKRKEREVRALNKYHGTMLAVRDAKVTELRRGHDDLQRELHEAHAATVKLRVENLSLGRCANEERRRAKEAVDAMKAELEHVLRMGTEFLATPKKDTGRKTAEKRHLEEDEEETGNETTTPDGSPLRSGAYFSGEHARASKGKKRRKYDSGLGFMDEDEDDCVDMV